MYTRMDNSGVEDICYEQEHVERVLAAIKKNFDDHFIRFLDSAGGKGLSLEDIQGLQKKFGIEIQKKKKHSDLTGNYKTIIREAIDSFEKDREDYRRWNKNSHALQGPSGYIPEP